MLSHISPCAMMKYSMKIYFSAMRRISHIRSKYTSPVGRYRLSVFLYGGQHAMSAIYRDCLPAFSDSAAISRSTSSHLSAAWLVNAVIRLISRFVRLESLLPLNTTYTTVPNGWVSSTKMIHVIL